MITKKQARQFLLLKQGLYGSKKFHGKTGILEFVQQAACVQFDPIDVCGKNHELVLQSRVEGFEKSQVYDLLYKDRVLIDWFDKNMSICLREDWPYFSFQREWAFTGKKSHQAIPQAMDEVIAYIKENGEVNSKDLSMQGKVDWYWGVPSSLARAVLDTLYDQGRLVISRKQNTRKYYDLPERHIQKEVLEAENPNRTRHEQWCWKVLRRIGGVGLLHANNSYAYIGIDGLKAKERGQVFTTLLEEKKIREIEVEDCKLPYYYLADDQALMNQVIAGVEESDRLEFVAPLDNLIWDRKMIEELFDFSYKWEIYTPIVDRKFGYYVLPILLGDRFIGRIEIKRNRKKKKMEILNIWWEDKADHTKENKKRVRDQVKQFSEIMV
ncbi:crosslink repair DNA glycosylase YcaQ family protein [Gottschalkiaceae bacterium SANA]|nr:crosslink repair DNA glycosylase YcaQ family protein [Gottschalkiaceae bacterium SANA]